MPPTGTVWALVEHRDGKLEDGALELVGHGREVAVKMGQAFVAVVFGDIDADLATQLARHGASSILSLQHPAVAERSVEIDTQLAAAAVRQLSPCVLLLLESIAGADLARRLAAHLGVGLVTSCDRLDTTEDGLLAATKPIYGGKASGVFVCPATRPQMATLNPDAIDLKARDDAATAEVVPIPLTVDLQAPKTRTTGFLQGDPRLVALTEADIVVAGGMGLGSQKNWKLVEDLADAVGGSVGATRRVVDEGWVTSERQVGQTGKTVRPKLYIACGISGAIQHTMGMKDAAAIVAINTDRQAPIFKIADVGVIGDVVRVLPVLTAKLREALKDQPGAGAGRVFDALSNP